VGPFQSSKTKAALAAFFSWVLTALAYIGERLAVVVAHDEGGGLFFRFPGVGD
jgi:hypothetical protein